MIMKPEDKKLIKDIMHNKDVERNLPVFTGAYTNLVYEYSLIHFLLNYYTIKEVEDDTSGISVDETLDHVMDDVHTLVYELLMSDEMHDLPDVIVNKLDDMRNLLTDKMTVLTAYTDGLQLYEYILNRIEYKITNQQYDVDVTSLAARVFRYLFQDNDKMVINSKIQLVTSQLPVRMTKNRFYEYLTDTLNIYNGSECISVDEFVERLKSTVLLVKPEGFGVDYPEIAGMIHTLEEIDFKSLDLCSYQAIMEQFAVTTNHLTELVSNYLLVMELINNLYTIALMVPYENSKKECVMSCKHMISGIHDAYVSGGSIPSFVDEELIQIEGVQESIGEDIVQYEAVLPEMINAHKEIIECSMLDKIINCLQLSSKLLSNSLFVSLKDVSDDLGVADADYINKKRDELVSLLSEFFGSHQKEMNRAVMASLFSGMPVLFNSQEEVKQYIEYSLGHCNNDSELMACAKILEDLMAEE
ncbi:MAG: hypothetical protein ACI4F4_04185 [Lachnospiraceae bacterium]